MIQLLLSYSFRNLLVRRGSTLLTAFGIALTVAVFAGIFALREGLEAVYQPLGSDDVAIYLRKAAHAVEYGMLAILLLRALWLGTRLSRAGAVLGTLAAAGLLAVADEARQGVSALRTGSAWDVALDLGGGAAAIALFLALQLWRRGPLVQRVRGSST